MKFAQECKTAATHNMKLPPPSLRYAPSSTAANLRAREAGSDQSNRRHSPRFHFVLLLRRELAVEAVWLVSADCASLPVVLANAIPLTFFRFPTSSLSCSMPLALLCRSPLRCRPSVSCPATVSLVLTRPSSADRRHQCDLSVSARVLHFRLHRSHPGLSHSLPLLPQPLPP